MKTPEEFKQSVYQKHTSAKAARRRRRMVAVGIAAPVCALILCFGFPAIRQDLTAHTSEAAGSTSFSTTTADDRGSLAETETAPEITLLSSTINESFSAPVSSFCDADSLSEQKTTTCSITVDKNDGETASHWVLSDSARCDRIVMLLEMLEGEPIGISPNTVTTVTINYSGENSFRQTIFLTDSAFRRENGSWQTADPDLLQEIDSLLQPES